MELTNLEIVEKRTLFKVYSLYYWSRGFNITHINGLKQGNVIVNHKSATHSIEKLKNERQEYNQVSLFDWNNATGIGGVSGVSFIRCLDIDGSSSFEFLRDILMRLGLKEKYEWVVRSGSNNGYHVWVRVKELPEGYEDSENYVFWPKGSYSQYFKRIELRWNSHTLLPPSVHYSGNSYKFLNIDLPESTPALIQSNVLSSVLSQISSLETKPANINLLGGETEQKQDEALPVPKYNSLSESEDKILFIDVETSGLPSSKYPTYDELDCWPYVLQVAWIQSTSLNAEVLYEKSFYLKPGDIEIEPSALAIHGITREFAQKNGLKREVVLQNLAEFISSSQYIVAHNSDFDVSLLMCEFLRIGIDVDSLFYGKKVICTMKNTVSFCKIPSTYGGYKWPSLQELNKHLFGTKFDGEHNAKVDIRRTYVCFFKLLEEGVIGLSKSSTTAFYDDEPRDLPF